MAHKLFLFNFLVLPLVLISCNSIEPPPNETFTLKLEDVSSIEAWIKLTTTNLHLPASISLKQNNLTISTINLVKPDTLLYIDSLLPNQTYSFQASINTSEVKSNVLSITTLDTTSHNFTWQTFTFGEHSSSVLYDVAIINENNIWVVGEIYMNGSLGNPDPNAYGFAKWDGNGWKLFRLEATASNGNISNVRPKGILVFNENDIWFTGGSVWHWNGQNLVFSLERLNFFNGGPESIDKLWGTSEDNIYGVGTYGTIVHYTNGQWKKIESGTDTDFKDIYGTPDGKEIWACGWTNRNGRVAIVKIKESGEVESIWDSQTNREFSYYYNGQLLNTLWANGNGEFVFATGVVTRHSLLDKRILRFDWVPYLNGQQVLHLGNYAYRIRGSNKNNIAVAGDEAMIWHYNGATWHKFEELQYFDDRLYSLAVTYNLIIAVGKRYSGLTSGALLLVGRR